MNSDDIYERNERMDMLADDYQELKEKYEKLLEFVKECSLNHEDRKFEDEHDIHLHAISLLEEIGEL